MSETGVSTAGRTKDVDGFEPLFDVLKMSAVAADGAGEPEALDVLAANGAERGRTGALLAASCAAEFHECAAVGEFGYFREL